MPYSLKNPPDMIKSLPRGAQKVFIDTFNAVLDETKNEDTARKAAWSNVKNEYRKAGDKWIPKSALIDIPLIITKASLHNGVMRWQAVASDTAEDRTGEATSLPLFQDWIERAETGRGVDFLPAPRRPFLGLSHYPALDGFGEAGPTEQMYTDGSRFKAAGIFYGDPGHPLGKALFEAVRNEREMVQRGEAIEQPIRISAAWWDIAHRHGDFIFERKSLNDVCPLCAKGAGGKIYLKGQLDHFAATRVPINPRTSLALEEKSMTTRKEDAESIIGDPALAEELDKRAKLVGKAETEEAPGLVVKADEAAPAKMEDEEEMDEAPYGGAMSMEDIEKYMAGQDLKWQAMSSWQMFSTAMSNIMEHAGPDEMKAKMQNLLSEFSDRVAALKAAVEDAYLIQPTGGEIVAEETTPNALEAAFVALKAIVEDGKLNRVQKVDQAQKAFADFAEVVKAQVDAVTPPDQNAEVNKAILENLQLLNARLAGQTVQPAAVPQQKSFVPGPAALPAQKAPVVSPVTGQPSKLTEMVRRSVGIV